jgi:glycosyltransferase involved in cell wall biosynthesis
MCLAERGRVVHNGVDISEFAGPHESAERPRPFVLAIGRHVRQKGFDVLIDAFASLIEDKAFHWDLLIAGDGPERERLIAQVHGRGLTDRVDFVGRADRAMAVRLFRSAAAFALPSLHEPFGIVNLEAMAAGAPVVATRVGGVPEFVDDGLSGLLVPPGDAGALAAALRRLFDEPGLRERLSHRGREMAASFDWARIEQDYREVYASARRHKAAGRRRR